jgi:hypothetical protein
MAMISRQRFLETKSTISQFRNNEILKFKASAPHRWNGLQQKSLYFETKRYSNILQTTTRPPPSQSSTGPHVGIFL